MNPDYLPEFQSTSSYTWKLKAEQEFSSHHEYDAYLRRYCAMVALRAFADTEVPTKELVRDVIDVANRLVAELRSEETSQSG